jgi:hypothetical protein
MPSAPWRNYPKALACRHLAPQISAGGRTVSLGDYVSEADAARAYDRACISRAGSSARTNFPVEEYAAEIDQLTGEPPRAAPLLAPASIRAFCSTPLPSAQCIPPALSSFPFRPLQP